MFIHINGLLCVYLLLCVAYASRLKMSETESVYFVSEYIDKHYEFICVCVLYVSAY